MPSFLFEINPVPASRPRVSRWSTYYPKTYTAFREEMKDLLKKYPRLMIEGPIKVSVKFFREIPKSFPKHKKEALEGQYVVANFDLDNLEKAIYDAMNDYIFVDDSQIVHHETAKYWSSNPRIEITIETL